KGNSMGQLALRIMHAGAKLVVIDNLGQVSGDADENSGEMVSVMSSFRQLAEDTGAAIVLVHHQRKGNGITGRAGDSLRGHSSIEAALDLALLIEREDQADTISIRATKVRGADVPPFSALFAYENDPAGELYTARFLGIYTEDTKSAPAIEREIMAALYGTSMNKTELVKAAREQLPEVGLNRIRDMVDRLASQGKLKQAPGKNNTERIYSRA
ncbi:MAG: AAA family ATPase, partial [Chloroflexota bacterium]